MAHELGHIVLHVRNLPLRNGNAFSNSGPNGTFALEIFL